MAAADEKPEVGRAPRPAPFRTVAADAAELEARVSPLAARGTLYALLALVVVAVLWATFSDLDRIVTATGRVITRAQPVVIQSLETAVVRSIDVRVGQAVKKGQRLVSLDPTFADADVSQVRTRLDSLDAEVARLQAELEGKPYSPPPGPPGPEVGDGRLHQELHAKRRAEYEARLTGFRADLARLEADLVGTRRSVAVLEERLKGLRQIEAMKSNLQEKGFVSQMSVLESKTLKLEAEQAYEDSVNKSRQLVEQAGQVRAAMQAYVEGWRQKTLDDLVRARRDRDALREQLAKFERRGALVVLTAPYDAIVLEINKRSVGSVAKEADPILTLVPEGDELEAEVQIAAEDIGFVRKGDPVRVKIDAFPFQLHGTLEGRLAVVGADSFPADPAQQAGRATRAHFSARISDFQGTLRAVPADYRLAPGMTVTAEIRVGKRSVISYFAYPLIKAFDEGMREP